MTNDINITIGSDPEFVIMCGDKVENALEIFTRLQKPDYCCECPHPSREDIENIYDGDKRYYIEETLKDQDVYWLIDNFPKIAAKSLFQIMNLEEIKQLEIIKEIVKLKNKILKQFDEKIELEKLDENEQELKIIDLLYDYTIYLKKIHEELDDKKKINFYSILIIYIIQFYEDVGYPNLRDLPEEIKDNIFEQIVDNYENDCSACNIQEGYFCSTELGCDGQSILGEMRPKHGNTPIEHFNQILKLMEELNDMLAPEIICHGSDQLQVKAGAIIEGIQERYQLGGHIHIGFDEIQKESPRKAQYIQKNIKYPLAIYVGIPLTLIEKIKELTRHSSYGSFAASRNGEKYFGTEFRMPSSWLVSPQITIGALSLAYVVAHDYITVMMSNDDKYRNEEFFDDVQSYTGLYNDYINLINGDLLEETPDLYSKIQQMELYPIYKVYIDYIFDMIEKNKIWESDKNILPRWAELW